MKYFRRFPVELYVAFLMLMSVILFFSVSVISGYVPFNIVPINVTSESFFGGRFFYLFLNIVYIFILFQTSKQLYDLLIKYKQQSISLSFLLKEITKKIFAVLFWVLVLFLVTSIFNYSLGYIFSNAPEHRIEYFTNVFMQADKFFLVCIHLFGFKV